MNNYFQIRRTYFEKSALEIPLLEPYKIDRMINTLENQNLKRYQWIEAHPCIQCNNISATVNASINLPLSSKSIGIFGRLS